MHRKTPASAGPSSRPDGASVTPWHGSPQALRFIIARYVPLFAAGNLVWEVLHLPLYTLGRESDHGAMLFAVLHCTAGHVLIGIAVLLLSIILFGGHGWPRRKHVRVLGATTVAGVVYTVWSEWVNTELTLGWEYTDAMLRVPPFETGITPLLQWLVVPPVAYGLAYALGTRRAAAMATR